MIGIKKPFPNCPHCHKPITVRKHGKARSGIQRYFCRGCHKAFQDKYIYFAYRESEMIRP
ncbi:transposase [Budvicia aquatica]|uniref:transposase n=1 Tax=Budvicia aquatica TaxID=82979 RepID=UPI003D157C4C